MLLCCLACSTGRSLIIELLTPIDQTHAIDQLIHSLRGFTSTNPSTTSYGMHLIAHSTGKIQHPKPSAATDALASSCAIHYKVGHCGAQQICRGRSSNSTSTIGSGHGASSNGSRGAAGVQHDDNSADDVDDANIKVTLATTSRCKPFSLSMQCRTAPVVSARGQITSS